MINRPYEEIAEGFVSEHGSNPSYGDTQNIFFPVTGNLIVLRDRATKKIDTTTMLLSDDFTRHTTPIAQVSFLNQVSNPTEGKKKFPRPWVYEYADDDKTKLPKLISQGDKLLIQYVEGNIYNPLVVGSIESLAITNQLQFLQYDPSNLERQPERYDNDDYTLEYENDGKGNHVWVLMAHPADPKKGNVGGSGNITIELIGTQGNGQVNIGMNGLLKFSQKDANGKVIQSLMMDVDNGGIFAMGKTQGKNENIMYGKTTNQLLSDLIDAILGLVFMTNMGATTGIVPDSITKLKNLQSSLPKNLVD